MPHLAIVRLVRQQSYVRLDAEERLLQASSISFDAATFEIWGSLLNGGELVLLPDRDPGRVASTIADRKITTLWLTAQLFQLMVDDHLEAFASVRQLITGGDVVSPHHAKLFLTRYPDHALINGYGPTENTTFSCCGSLSADLGESAPIGHPIDHASAYILDNFLNPAPTGIDGDLYVGGLGLARGYHRRRAATAEKFIPNPFAATDEGGSRLYATGDRARWLPTGDIIFRGRADHQVKIRGYRIEPGEVEAALMSHDAIVAAAVQPGKDAMGARQLVAYIVAPGWHLVSSDNSSALASTLRDYLSKRLPNYMVPSVFVPLPSLPMTPHGKLDRRHLPDPQVQKATFTAPATPYETALVDIWCEVLDVPKVGTTDNFFELGGHSLLGTRVMSRIRKQFGVDLRLRVLFEGPTIQMLARNVEMAAAPDQHQAAQLPPITPQSRSAGIPLSFSQQRLWFLDQLERQSADASIAYNIPYRVSFRGPLSVRDMARAFVALVDRHEILRTLFVLEGAEPRQQIGPPSGTRMAVLDLTHLPRVAARALVDELAEADARTPFDLTHGPLLRIRLIRIEARRHILLLNLHHIIADGWSMGVLVRDMSMLYRTELELPGPGSVEDRSEPAVTPPLAPLPFQYADFAIWQRHALGVTVLQQQLAYWQEKLSSAPSSLQFPFDRPRPKVQSFRGDYYTFSFDADLAGQLQALAHRTGSTLFMVLEAAFAALLAKYTHQQEIMLGSPVANRNREELEPLIGFFVNTLVFRNDLGGDPSFLALITRTRKLALEAYAHQDIPFEQVVEAVQPERNLSQAPVFQAMIMLLNTPAEGLDMPGLRMSVADTGNKTAKFDLLLSLIEGPEGIGASLEYNTDLLDRSTVARLADHWKVLIRAALAAPEARLSQLSILEAEERRRVVETWNQTRSAAPRDKVLPRYFEDLAATHPDDVAIETTGLEPPEKTESALTYRELNERANRLAFHFQTLGIGPNKRIGLCLPRSIDLMVGLLAILKGWRGLRTARPGLPGRPT